jgi:hypothetical protein
MCQRTELNLTTVHCILAHKLLTYVQSAVNMRGAGHSQLDVHSHYTIRLVYYVTLALFLSLIPHQLTVFAENIRSLLHDQKTLIFPSALQPPALPHIYQAAPQGFLNSYCKYSAKYIKPLKAELNPICHLLALLGAHHILHVSRIRVK